MECLPPSLSLSLSVCAIQETHPVDILYIIAEIIHKARFTRIQIQVRIRRRMHAPLTLTFTTTSAFSLPASLSEKTSHWQRLSLMALKIHDIYVVHVKDFQSVMRKEFPLLRHFLYYRWMGLTKKKKWSIEKGENMRSEEVKGVNPFVVHTC